jgi:hypothetical protein
MSAHKGWTAAIAIGRAAERVASLHASSDEARATLLAIADIVRYDDEHIAAMRERVERRAPTVFFEFARDAASAFENPEAAEMMQVPLAALVEAIRIIDDIQDEEAHCLASEIGVDAALHVAMGALAWSLELTAALPLEGAAWREAAVSIGRAIRETATGQMLEASADETSDDYWHIVDSKTPPLVATALELGALAAGAEPARAAALTKLAFPLGRMLQIGDDCHDALGPDAADWRKPSRNLLMRYTLSGPRGGELTELLRDSADTRSLRAAQVLLLRDGALGYALHAQVVTLQTLAEELGALALPDPAPFLVSLERHRADVDQLLRTSGVSEELAGSVVASTRSRPPDFAR